MQDDIRLFPISHLKFINKLLSTNGVGYAETSGEGSAAKELHRKGIIEPFGRGGRSIRWRIMRVFTNGDISLIEGIVSHE
jgi:hypothetical protein